MTDENTRNALVFNDPEIAAFLNSVRTGKPPLVTGEDGWRALEAALMITRSLRSHWQMLGEQSFHPRGAVWAAPPGNSAGAGASPRPPLFRDFTLPRP